MKIFEKELAFLRGLNVETDWTSKFTDFFDKKFKVGKKDTFLYLNAGSGNHALGLNKKLGRDSEMFAVSENTELQKIAQEKATAVKSDLYFSTHLPLVESEFVLADASFVEPGEIDEFIANAVKLAKKEIVFFLPTAGSFGEVFSYLWEVFLDLDLIEKGAEVEKLILDLPAVSDLEDSLSRLGFKKTQTTTKNEFVEFESGKEFRESPLIKYFLIPVWLKFLNQKEKEQVITKLAQKIDDESGEVNFRVSIKATLLSGIKK